MNESAIKILICAFYFRCELCDKSFMLPTHLSTHMRTGVHKRTVEKYQMKQQMQHDPAMQLKLEMDEESLHIQDWRIYFDYNCTHILRNKIAT